MRPVSARFSPTWWAAWTCALHRPGRLDDEEIPEGVDGATPVWAHYPAGAAVEGRVWDRELRPDWPTLLVAQHRRAPLPTDGCRLHDGRCGGGCDR